ncbi:MULTISPECIES: hypothetical protein [Niastella]|uniref:Cytochrome c domain-containing protein n=1 Tax=Niastella soli TaxID=2821487 RepID=A0ABS3Z2Z5_9BACT|nr:hypothetical protein [Niastella soli]MBO9204546.1 hypothetical protein [Niastella soli]
MNRIITVGTVLIFIFAGGSFLPGNSMYGRGTNASMLLLPRLSDYNIFTGDPVQLRPGNGFQLYELATGLFTDYAEKQRLIKIPAGKTITVVNDGLPLFPDGTILVKTFYYYNDKRDTKGKRLIETRLLIKRNNQWVAGTYVWNPEQNDAILATGGSNVAVTWIDEKSVVRKISYRIPGVRDCASCHNTNNTLMPIGLKVRNLNRTVERNNRSINQLQYLYEAGITDAIDPEQFAALPAWQNEKYALQDRVRAYLDVNCAHCHSDAGSCARSAVRFAWEIPLPDTRIVAKNKRIVSLMAKGSMPRTGTTIVDEQALALIKKYFQLQ